MNDCYCFTALRCIAMHCDAMLLCIKEDWMYATGTGTVECLSNMCLFLHSLGRASCSVFDGSWFPSLYRRAKQNNNKLTLNIEH
jgi:hypothetical protein